jgi:hypothetical protein
VINCGQTLGTCKCNNSGTPKLPKENIKRIVRNFSLPSRRIYGDFKEL